VLYPQNGDSIVTVDSVTSLHPPYVYFVISPQPNTDIPPYLYRLLVLYRPSRVLRSSFSANLSYAFLALILLSVLAVSMQLPPQLFETPFWTQSVHPIRLIHSFRQHRKAHLFPPAFNTPSHAWRQTPAPGLGPRQRCFLLVRPSVRTYVCVTSRTHSPTSLSLTSSFLLFHSFIHSFVRFYLQSKTD